MASTKQNEAGKSAKITVSTADGRHTVRVLDGKGKKLFSRSCPETVLQGPLRANLKGVYSIRAAAVRYCVKWNLELENYFSSKEKSDASETGSKGTSGINAAHLDQHG